MAPRKIYPRLLQILTPILGQVIMNKADFSWFQIERQKIWVSRSKYPIYIADKNAASIHSNVIYDGAVVSPLNYSANSICLFFTFLSSASAIFFTVSNAQTSD